MNPVGAFRITGDLAAGCIAGWNNAAIVEPHQGAVLEHGEIGAVRPFPGLVGDEHDFALHGQLQLQCHASA